MYLKVSNHYLFIIIAVCGFLISSCFMVVSVQIVILWVVTLCNGYISGYQHFRGKCWLHVHNQSEGGCTMFFQNIGIHLQATQHHIPEDYNLCNY